MSTPSFQPQQVYHPEADLEDFEDYTIGGYHPIVVGSTLKQNRYTIIHKLGFGGYSTIWLARDQLLGRFVAIKVLVATESLKNREAQILHTLQEGNDNPRGRQFIQHLLDRFQAEGPNGDHICLVLEPAACSIAASKESSANLMFSADTARSIAAQLILGVAYMHTHGVCHGDLHLRNLLLMGSGVNEFNPEMLYERFPLTKIPLRRVDGLAVQPNAPPYAVYPMCISMPAQNVRDPVIQISDFGTSFMPSQESLHELCTPPLYLCPEAFFGEPITMAADIWTLGATLYEILGERPLFESFTSDRDDIFADMISTLGLPPRRWWEQWTNRGEFFREDGSWLESIQRIYTPGFRPLLQRLLDMGRGETIETCEWNVQDGELNALEALLGSLLSFEPSDRPDINQILKSDYFVNWALPAWERQRLRTGAY